MLASIPLVAIQNRAGGRPLQGTLGLGACCVCQQMHGNKRIVPLTCMRSCGHMRSTLKGKVLEKALDLLMVSPV